MVQVGNMGMVAERVTQEHWTCYYFSKFPLSLLHGSILLLIVHTGAAISVRGAHVPSPRGESEALASYLCVFPDGELLTLGLLGCID